MKPSLPKGTRDFTPAELAQRQYIIRILRKHFERYGFQPIETPSFENLSTLTGKYGDEGDRLIFKILNSGDFLKGLTREQWQEPDSTAWTPLISEKALRYDLTVPFARFVVMNRNELEMPFRRYQIQQVWRADRPQKGRFREFMQCDADVVGSDSLLLEVELALLYDRVFTELGLCGCTIKINHRKVLMALAEAAGVEEAGVSAFTVSLDKLDKIGPASVREEWSSQGISAEGLERLEVLLSSQDRDRMLDQIRPLLTESESGRIGLKEIDWVLGTVREAGLRSSRLSFDLTLARGLNYYTGCIFEVSAPEGVEMGSIGGGGRYDNLTGIFGLPGVSGVGISFGLDRIQLVMKQLELFPEGIRLAPDVLIACMEEEGAADRLRLAAGLHEQGIKAECYPDPQKLQKQFKYADRKGVPFLLIRGEAERSRGVFQLKDLQSGEQREFPDQGFAEASEFIRTGG